MPVKGFKKMVCSREKSWVGDKQIGGGGGGCGCCGDGWGVGCGGASGGGG